MFKKNKHNYDLSALSNIILKHNAEKPVKNQTPREILFSVFSPLCDNADSEMLRQLSLLATDGADSTLFGNDFDLFFSLFISALNISSKMKQILDENGIEFNLDDTDNM